MNEKRPAAEPYESQTDLLPTYAFVNRASSYDRDGMLKTLSGEEAST